MICTDDFVYIHEPKTGGTFTSAVLHRIYAPSWHQRILSKTQKLIGQPIQYRTKYGLFVDYWKQRKHATCSQIPKPHHNKVILASIRNPFDLYVSEYHFGWWKKRAYWRHYRELPGFNTKYRHFPNLSFEEYVHFFNPNKCEQKGSAQATVGVGPFTKRFVRYYCDSSQKIIQRLDHASQSDAELRSLLSEIKKSLFKVHFIFTDQLNQNLHQFLLSQRYEPEDIQFVFDLEKIRPKESCERSKSWSQYYTSSLKEFVFGRERILFELFPHFSKTSLVKMTDASLDLRSQSSVIQ